MDVIFSFCTAGTVVAALRTRSFKLALSSWCELSRHLFSGILMRTGAVIGMLPGIYIVMQVQTSENKKTGN